VNRSSSDRAGFVSNTAKTFTLLAGLSGLTARLLGSRSGNPMANR
jgi:hypothetical protein